MDKPTYDPDTPLLQVLLAPRDALPPLSTGIARLLLAERSDAPSVQAVADRLTLRPAQVRGALESVLYAADRDVRFSPVIGPILSRAAQSRAVTLDSIAAEPWAEGLGPEGIRLVVNRLGGHRTIMARGMALVVPGTARDWKAAVDGLAGLAARSDPARPATDLYRDAVRFLRKPLVAPLGHALAAAFPAHDALGLRRLACPTVCFVDGLLPPGAPPRRLKDLLRRVARASPVPASEAWLLWILQCHALALGPDLFVSDRNAGLAETDAAPVLATCLELLRTMPGVSFSTGSLLDWAVQRTGRLPDGLDAPEIDRILSGCHEAKRDGEGRWSLAHAGDPRPEATRRAAGP